MILKSRLIKVLVIFIILGAYIASTLFSSNKQNASTVIAASYEVPPYLVYDYSTIPIVGYHRILPASEIEPKSNAVSIENFRNQLHYIQEEGYTTLSLDGFYGLLQQPGQNNCSFPRKKYIVLTFDDGTADFMNAFEILKEFNMRATVFMISQAVGHRANQDDVGYFSTMDYLTTDQIKTIESSGLVKVQSHTQHHCNLRDGYAQAGSGNNCTDPITNELSNSKNNLKAKSGHDINFIAYPYGAYNERVKQWARSAGYLGAFLYSENDQKSAHCNVDKMEIPRWYARNKPFSSWSGPSSYQPPSSNPADSFGYNFKAAVEKILKKPEHSKITETSKGQFFNRLNIDGYFWKSDKETRRAMRQQYASENKNFSDGTPWAWVLGDVDGVFETQLEKLNIKKTASVSFDQSSDARKNIENFVRENYQALKLDNMENMLAHAEGDGVQAALQTEIINDDIETINGESVNVTNIMTYSSLSIENQRRALSLLTNAVYANGSKIKLNNIKIVSASNSFTEGSENFIIDKDKKLFFNESIFLLSEDEINKSLKAGLEKWSL